jgi:dolichyl-phosphate beta-glucosyltransferase
MRRSKNPLHAIIVVPCYNEARRIPMKDFLLFFNGRPSMGVIFVNDGSTDGTLVVLSLIAQELPEQAHVLNHVANQGKAEAVRSGILYALGLKPKYVGYWDADLATPLCDIERFCEVLETNEDAHIVFGARVQLLGRVIERKVVRHYLGRVFATMAATVLSLHVYDTQCGAKVFRATELTERLFKQPFLSRWIFDVEIIARLIRYSRQGASRSPADLIIEYPLETWVDVGKSRVRPIDFLRAMIDLWRIHRRYLHRGNYGPT